MSQIEPGDREEMLLAGILNGDTETNIEPGSRKERLLRGILESSGKTAERLDDEVLKVIFDTVNIYDEDHDAIYVTSADVPTEDTTSQFRRGTVYFYGYSGDIVISTRRNQAGYFSALHAYDKSGGEIPGVSFGAAVQSPEEEVPGTDPPVNYSYRHGYVVTIPEGTDHITFKYRTYSNTGGVYKTLVSYPMVTKGSTIADSAFVPYAAHHVVSDTVTEERGTRPVYVSTTGSDDNDGWTFETAVATFEKALRLSNVIYAERGVYAENVTVKDKENVVIAPYDNDDWVPPTDPSYVAGTPRQMIEFNGGEVRTPSPGEYLFVSDYEGGLMFDLFSQDPNNPGPDFLDLVANESKKQYRCNVFVNLFDGGKLKLKPVWTQEDLTDDTFTWDPETRLLAMNVTSAAWGQDFYTVTILKQTTNFRVQNCKNVRISDLAVKYNYSTCIGVENSDDVTFTNCEASFSATGMGFGFKSTNGRLEHCFAQGNGVDGFNFHEYGYSEMTDCDSFWNWDDGCSHHQGCVGTINGGTFKGNGKAGIAPAYGATVNIFGAVCESNDQYGIGYLYDQTRQLTAKGVVNGGVVSDNPIGLKVEEYCTVTAVGLKYEGNIDNRSVAGTLNEFGDKEPLTVILNWVSDDNRYYANRTMAEIAAAIAAGRNVTVSYEIPDYGVRFESPLAAHAEVDVGGGTMMYIYVVQAVDSNTGTLMAVTAQGYAADNEWTLNAYSL